MKRSIGKALALLCGAALVLGGCSSQKVMEKIVTDSCDVYYEDSSGMLVPDTDYLDLPQFGAVPENSVFNVDWVTVEDEYSAGTAVLVQTDLSADPLLLTAYHIFEADAFELTPATLKDYLTGGYLMDVMSMEEDPPYIAAIEEVITIPDAEAVWDTQKPDKDLAAFRLDIPQGLTAYPLASEPCKPGDTIYLVASLWKTDSYYDDNTYPCLVAADNGTQLTYILSDEFGTTGASGGPLLNTKGELVGIHIASNGSIRVGHSAQSMYDQLKNAMK